MSTSAIITAIQAAETLLGTTYSEITEIEREGQADKINFLDALDEPTVPVVMPYGLLTYGEIENGEMGSDAVRDFAGVLNFWYIRDRVFSASEIAAGYKRFDDWGGDKARDIAAILNAWPAQSGGPFWVGEPLADFSAKNQLNTLFNDKGLDFYAVLVAVSFEVAST